jgi:hypothetical protein
MFLFIFRICTKVKRKAKCVDKDEVEDDDSVVDDDPHGQVADPGG